MNDVDRADNNIDFKTKMNILDIVYRKRLLIAIILIFVGTILQLNGSSIGEWANYFPSNTGNGVLLGRPRPIRSDEWALFTPMIISQQFGETPFSWISSVIGGGGVDVGIVYGLPVMSIWSFLFRPFLNAHLLLGPGYGLSFFWCARFIILLLVYFELIMLFTDKNKPVSLLGSGLVALSPMVQWWFAINGMVEMLIFGATAVLLLNVFLTNEKRWIKLLCLFGLYICAGGYVVTFYPAQMIPLAYVFGTLAIIVVLKERGHIKVDRIDCLSAAGMVLAFVMTILLLYQQHAETISAVVNSAYPGNSFTNGGGAFNRYFLEWGNLFFPVKAENILWNECESAVMRGFFPLGIVLTVCSMIQKKKADIVSVGLLTVWSFLTLFLVFGYPNFVVKYSLLYRVSERAMVAVGLLNILLLVNGLVHCKVTLKRRTMVIISIVYAFMAIVCERFSYGVYLTRKLDLIIVILAALTVYSLMIFKRRCAPAFIVIGFILLLSGGTVNPIQHGYKDAINSDLGIAISDVVKDDPTAKWVVEEMGYPRSNYPIMFGAPTVNSTNVYPRLSVWEPLDPNGEYTEIYNRYAHIDVNLTDSVGERFVLLYPDHFSVDVTLSELAEILNVDYIITNRNLEEYENDDYKVEPVTSTDGYIIYKIFSKGVVSGK